MMLADRPAVVVVPPRLIFETITSIPIEGRIGKLLAGDKLIFLIDKVPEEEKPDYCSINIWKLTKLAPEMMREIIYDTGNLFEGAPTMPFTRSFEVPEDGEYFIEIELKWKEKRAYVHVKLYLQREKIRILL